MRYCPAGAHAVAAGLMQLRPHPARCPPSPLHTPARPPGVIEFGEFLRMFRSELLDLAVSQRWGLCGWVGGHARQLCVGRA